MFSSNTSQVSNAAVFVEDVFSTWLYTGNGSTQTVTNGIDLAGKGGLVWIKGRNLASDNVLFDTARGTSFELRSNATNGNIPQANGVTAFNTNGFNLGNYASVNQSSSTFVSWTFREQPKFFDIVTWTGNDTNRTISHNLGSVPGCIMVKRLDTAAEWRVYHRANTASPQNNYLVLNTSAPTVDPGITPPWNDTAPTSTVFSIGTEANVNASGGTYIAYLFAHNAGGFGLTGTDNIISCGGYAGNSSTVNQITLGYEPQWVLIKNISDNTSWRLMDTMRGMPVLTSGDPIALLMPNLSSAELLSNYASPNATGFTLNTANSNVNLSGNSYIYIAIRRGPMRTPTTGTSVLSLQTYTGDDSTRTLTTGFPVDLAIGSSLSSSAGNSATFSTRLTGTNRYMNTASTGAEVVGGNSLTGFDIQTGVGVNGPSNFTYNFGSIPYVLPAFRRAPGFMDVCCYTGTGVARTVTHNLAAVPELMIVKRRDTAANWSVYSASTGPTVVAFLNIANPFQASSAFWNDTNPTASVFTLGTSTTINASGGTYVNYLFASVPGVSKVGSFTGTGATQVINCGFTAGARFVLIKATSTTGDWYVWDSARGIVAGNDPYLRWNANGNQITNTDWVNTAATGFELSNNAGNLANSNGVSYIFWAVA